MIPFFSSCAEIIKKGTAYLSVAMYMIRELEDALYDCDTKCTVSVPRTRSFVDDDLPTTHIILYVLYVS